MPTFFMTRIDRALSGVVNDTSCSIRSSSNACRITAPAPSVASPLPQCSWAIRHPTSTAGINGASKAGIDKPKNPTKHWSSRNSAAYMPKPCARKWLSMRSTNRSLSFRSRQLGMNSITRGSEFMRANDSRSASSHRLNKSLSVLKQAAIILLVWRYSVHFQSRTSGKSSPFSETYSLCRWICSVYRW